MNEQKSMLLAKGWTEEELRANQWHPRPWTDEDDARHDRAMEVRDLLNCENPRCKSVGCFKPRRNEEYEHPRYYVCKWCGYGRNFDGEWQYWPDKKNHCWGIKTPDSIPTPKEILEPYNIDPWCG